MKTRRFIISLIAAALAYAPLSFAQTSPVVRPEAAGLSSERLARIDRVLKTYTDEKKIPGVVALIARHGKIGYLKSFGMANIETGTPMKKDSMFRIASMSKPLTTTAVLMLYEQGYFLLNDPVSKFLPEFRDMKVILPDSSGKSYTLVPAKGPITIRHLLNHTSGITYGGELHDELYKNAGITAGLNPTKGTTGEMVTRLAGLPLINQPGEEFRYGLSLDVLGRLVEVVSGMPLNQFMEQRIFSPLGMKDTCFVLPKEKLPRMAHLYRLNGKGVLEQDQYGVEFLCDRTYFSGGAGVISTAADYVRFAQMILDKGRYNGVRLLSRKTVELMTTNSLGALDGPFPDSGADKFGYGFGIRTERGLYDEMESMGIFGWDGAFHTRFWIDPKEDLIAIFMTQSDTGTLLYTRFRPLVYQAIAD